MVTVLCVFNSFHKSKDILFDSLLSITLSPFPSPGIWKEALKRLCQEIISLRAVPRTSLLPPLRVDGFCKCFLTLPTFEPLSLFVLILCSGGWETSVVPQSFRTRSQLFVPRLLPIIFCSSPSDPCVIKAVGSVASGWPFGDVPGFPMQAAQFPSFFVDSCYIWSSKDLDVVPIRTTSFLSCKISGAHSCLLLISLLLE